MFKNGKESKFVKAAKKVTPFSLAVVAAAVIMLPVILGSCGSPLGFGKPIDWEPPILDLDPIGNPEYVRTGTKLTGIVSDNIGVATVILRDSKTGEQLSQAQTTLTPLGSKDSEGRVQYSWEMVLSFGEEYNGSKLAAMIVAFDTSGRSGEESMAAVTLVIDTRPPIVQDIRIGRTERKEGWLEPYSVLKALEGTDQEGHKSANVDRYQNGVFTIKAKLAEEETRIKSVNLLIFDVNDPDNELYSMPMTEGASPFTPSWDVYEETILDNGSVMIDPDYKGNYYNGARYYYRVAIQARDLSGNESSIKDEDIQETVGYFCMWAEADKPKGVLDPIVGTVTSRGTPLPVEFFDDDVLQWAYAGLLTIEQWEGKRPIASGVYMMGGTVAAGENGIPYSDNAKLTWLKDRLRGGNPAVPQGNVFNWRQDRWPASTEQIEELLKTDAGKVYERWEYVTTGNGETDYGEFVLFSLAGDTKLPPHPLRGENDNVVPTLKPDWNGLVWPISMIDENAPLIVFDTVNTSAGQTPAYNPDTHLGNDTLDGAATGNSPEENTFPRNLTNNGSTFEINGYTLREDKGHQNGVVKFRVAWIPYNLPGGPDNYITAVQNALENPALFSALPGVQYWDFQPADRDVLGTPMSGVTPLPPTSGDAWLINGTEQKIGDVPGQEGIYRKQVFRKKFNLLGGTDDLKSAYKNFTYDGDFENETKLFIFYAEDNMGHPVHRQLRLLGEKAPPELTVYDISGEVQNNDPGLNGIPNVLAPLYGGEPTNQYYTDLKAYNIKPAVYGALKAGAAAAEASSTGLKRTPAWQTYPRGTTLKYWVKAGMGTAGLQIQRITMLDITNDEAGKDVGSAYDGTDRAITFAESYPDETQRVFIFEAEDALGNVARIQRTVAITNAAKLESITTTTQNGTYGIGTRIVLKANFSGSVRVKGIPKLKVRYRINKGLATEAYKYEELNYSAADSGIVNGTSLYLGFPFIVGENYGGQLETVYNDFAGLTGDEARPIIIAPGSDPMGDQNAIVIIDNLRNSPAFVPGYTNGSATMPNWEAVDIGHLQGNGTAQAQGKQIYLDGVRPVITTVTVGGKDVYRTPTGSVAPNGTATNDRYFKTGETITLTLSTGSSGRSIGPSLTTAPVLQYYIQENPPNGTKRGPYNTRLVQGQQVGDFTYQRPDGINALVFNLTVDSTNAPYNGELVDVSLYNSVGIEDTLGNGVTSASVSDLLSLAGGAKIYIKQSTPAAPVSRLGGTEAVNGTAFATAATDWNVRPWLEVAPSAATPAAMAAWEDLRQYSTNGGQTWITYSTSNTSNAKTQVPVTGTLNLRTRYVDRAGNEGPVASKAIEVKDKFPKLIAVTPVQPSGWITSGGLDIKLDFDEPVKITAYANVSITIRDRSAAAGHTVNVNTATLTATGNNATLTSTIMLSLANVAAAPAKEMRNGLHITEVQFGGLEDSFGNTGFSWSITNGNIGSAITYAGNGTNCPNLNAPSQGGIQVDAIAPTVITYSPANSGVATATPTGANDYRNVITLTFREPVMKGNGTITVKPKSDFYIPAVFENNGYYLDQFSGTGNNTEVKSATSVQGRTTWVAGFYDIYNSGLSVDQRNWLTESTPATGSGGQNQTVTNTSYTPAPSSALDTSNPSMSRLRLDARTGQPVGPYVRTTHGLVPGAGYTGSYAGNATANGPEPAGAYMVPDTSTKWVLAYPYSISNADNVQYSTPANAANTTMTTPSTDVVTNIRAALVAAKFRWQEIDVISTNVTINGNSVQIIMTEPLLRGLEWELSYPAGTFTDLAGNTAGALAAGTYTFWSPGVQKPVIRVDRKSYDARTSVWQRPTTGNASTNFDYADPANNGWSIANFNSVAYRIETETPEATIYYGTLGRDAAQNSTSATATGAGPFYAITGDYYGAVARVNQGVTGYTTSNWDHAQATNGQWVRPNLIRRGQGTNAAGYTVNGVTRTFQGAYRGLRSYNADAQLSNFTGQATTGNANSYFKSTMTFTAREAGKAYVFADARKTNGGTAYTSNLGYEGVFRTVIVLAYDNNGTNSKILVEGSNIKNGMPSISGFPVQDAAESGDSRFVKMFYYDGTSTTGGTTYYQFYWVSTEIVSEWYFLKFGRSGSHQSVGEVNNYLMVGYGDLTYGYNITP